MNQTKPTAGVCHIREFLACHGGCHWTAQGDHQTRYAFIPAVPACIAYPRLARPDKRLIRTCHSLQRAFTLDGDEYHARLAHLSVDPSQPHEPYRDTSTFGLNPGLEETGSVLWDGAMPVDLSGVSASGRSRP